MAYKSLLTVLTRPAPLDLDAPIALARRENAHLDILCLAADRTPADFYYVGGAPVAPILLQAAADDARAEALAIEAAARNRLTAEEIPWAIDTTIAPAGLLHQQVGRLARFADLVVLSRAAGPGNPMADAVTEAALFDGQAPVLLLPPGTREAAFGQRITIAWNQSAEALRAVRAALPLLRRARSVDVAVIDPPAHGAERSDPGGMLSQFLSRHGVRAEVSVLARTLPKVADILCRHVEDIGSDMVVMGAYGHSRFREAILGGATRAMLDMAPVPVFAVH